MMSYIEMSKCIARVVIGLCFCLMFVVLPSYSYAKSAMQNFDYQNCSVSRTESIIRYYAHGKAAYGHEFGFVKEPLNGQDALWISWSAASDQIKQFKGTDIELQLSIGGIECEVTVPLVDCCRLGSITVFLMSNSTAGHRFVDLIAASKDVVVTIVGPKEFVEFCDIPQDSFDLSGFDEAQKKAGELFREVRMSGAPYNSTAESKNLKSGTPIKKQASLTLWDLSKSFKDSSKVENAQNVLMKELEAGNTEASAYIPWSYFKQYGTFDGIKDGYKYLKIAVENDIPLGIMLYAQFQRKLYKVGGNDEEIERWSKKASVSLTRAAESGNPVYQYLLGKEFCGGVSRIGIPYSKEEGIAWLNKAADQDFPDAISALSGQFSLMGESGEAERVRLDKRLVELGDVRGMKDLSLFFEYKGDKKKAFQWCLAAAKAGDNLYQAFLGNKYMNGLGTKQSTEEALKWFQSSLCHGSEVAMFYLGESYEKGQFVLQDYIEAYKWYLLGAARGDSFCVKGMKGLALKMTPKQIASAQSAAKKWKPTCDNLIN